MIRLVRQRFGRPIAIAFIVVAIAVRLWARGGSDDGADSGASRGDGNAPPASSTQWRANEQVEGSGVVDRVLPDDDDGSRHQRFILRLADGRTVLIAHNIDLAPRLTSLDRGDTVAFFGEFENNAQGGVIHWTHRDPAGRHVDGWLRHEGRTVK